MLPPIHDYDTLCREFRWPKLAHYNVGVDVCDKWAVQDPNRLAILNAHGGNDFKPRSVPTSTRLWRRGYLSRVTTSSPVSAAR